VQAAAEAHISAIWLNVILWKYNRAPNINANFELKLRKVLTRGILRSARDPINVSDNNVSHDFFFFSFGHKHDVNTADNTKT